MLFSHGFIDIVVVVVVIVVVVVVVEIRDHTRYGLFYISHLFSLLCIKDYNLCIRNLRCFIATIRG